MKYAELVCRSNFSFLRGASHPEELTEAAHVLGLSGMAITDDDGLYGMVKGWLSARHHGLRFAVGSRLTLEGAPPLVVYAADTQGYAHLCRLITETRTARPKGAPLALPWQRLADQSAGLLALLPEPPEGVEPGSLASLGTLAEAFPDRFYVGLLRGRAAGDEERLHRALGWSRVLKVPTVVHNDVHTHVRDRQRLQDVLTAIRHGTQVSELGARRFPNAERTLKSPQEMALLFDDHPEAVERTVELLERCEFSLDTLRYQYPEQLLPPGRTPQSHLEALTHEGLKQRYPQGTPAAVSHQISHELGMIDALGYAGYFLSIHELVHFARSRNILCQGRGSAANSAVCYALGITAIDPVRMGLLFERFISMDRREPPDIDVDFEHERREEVIQHVYEMHGRDRAAMVAAVVCYRGKLALRETGKALGLSLDQVDRLAKNLSSGFSPEALQALGLSSEDRAVRQTLELAGELEGFPRHLSIHSGGFVFTHHPLTDAAPVERAAMVGRTIVQWDKDDCSAMGLLKVDLLALGMLTVLSKSLRLLGKALTDIPPEDPDTYEMICQGDTIGVFQIESRAQMQMLPRLKPREFYDLVVEVAIIRPGPIVGEMVHPYIRRRDKLETVTYPNETVRKILGRTFGVPLFQEQAMRLAIEVAGFEPSEADGLRRAISHRRSEEMMAPYRTRFVEGAIARGYPADFAQTCFNQFKGFAHYGFPESHAASFALLAYASSWIKCHHPAVFCCALLNSQPMGFYAPHTLVEDAKRHGVEVRPIDVRHSSWDCTMEGGALRLGLRLVKGLGRETAARLEALESALPSTVAELAVRARIPRHELTRLALAGALRGFEADRRQLLWQIEALEAVDENDLFCGFIADDRVAFTLPPMTAKERVVTDYDTTHLSLESHPMALLRPGLNRRRALTAEATNESPRGLHIRVGGMSICRQRPPTAKGVAFLLLEDETGIANIVVAPELFEAQRREILGSLFLLVEGTVERAGKVCNVRAKRIERLAL